MSYFVFPDTGRNEKNELTVHTRTTVPYKIIMSYYYYNTIQ